MAESSPNLPTTVDNNLMDVEEAVIGTVLLNPDVFLPLAAYLLPDDFFAVRHRHIWDGMLRLTERSVPLDTMTVASELQARGLLQDVGGHAYLTRLLNSAPTSANADAYGRIVERAAVRRRMLQASDEIRGFALDQELSVEELAMKAEARLLQVTDRGGQRDYVPMAEAIDNYAAEVERLLNNQDGQALGLPTGFTKIDELLGGLQRSDLLIFAGRPGMGKTSFLLSLALNAAKTGARVGIFSLEMGVEQLVQRLIAMETGINMQRLRLGQIDDGEYGRYLEAIGRLGGLPIYIDDSPALTPVQLRTKCRRLKHEHGLDLVILDYVQLMNAGGLYNNNRVQEVSYISRALKEAARELNVPLLSAAQLSRAVEQRADKRPQLSDLRESGCIAGDELVYLPNEGRHVPIRDLAGRNGFQVLGLDTETWKLKPATVSAAFSTGTKPVFKLTTQLGRSIRATANHRFLTIDGWKRLDELTVGEHIALPRELKHDCIQTMLDSELGLLGHLLGDGCTLPRHAIQYTTREQDIAEVVVQLAEQHFGDTIKSRIHREPGHNWYQVFLASAQHLTYGVQSPVRTWLDALEAFGLRSYEKYIPTKVFAQPPDAIAVFLRHLWATDGCIGMKQTTKGFYPNVYYASSSHKLALGVQTLLAHLGINARLTRVPQGGKGRDQYHVIITGGPDLTTFVYRVGAVGERRRGLLHQVQTYIDTHNTNPNRDVIPKAVWRQMVVPAMAEIGLTSRQMQSQLGMQYCGTTLYKANLSRDRAATVAQIVQASALTALAQSDIYWDEVQVIEADGETDVYDLTVPETSNFTCNNIIVHNSLEQDADIVIFLYRDVVYNEATESPNLADIIVSKHRNGPTGTVSLYFDRTITKFMNGDVRKLDLGALA